ncbi:putative membrane protein [Vibrio cholerae HC-61A2]|nr:putative membrane protein [Vibrio cholerae HC-61A2]
MVFTSLLISYVFLNRCNGIKVDAFSSIVHSTDKSNNFNWFFLLLLLLFVIFFTVNLYIPLIYRHTDSVGYLNSFIRPVLYSGRFFPLGHQEFNFIRLKDVGFLGLFSIPFFQSLIAGFCLYKIIPIENKNLRVIVAIILFFSSFSISFSNLIIPERNQLFFLVIFLCVFLNDPSEGKLKFGLLISSLSLYYKEPTFTIYIAFAFSMIFFRALSGDLKINKTLKVSLLINRLKVEFYLFLSSLLFIVNYIVIRLLSPAEELYNQGSTYLEYISDVLSLKGIIQYPFLLMVIFGVFYFLRFGLNSDYCKKAFLLFSGSVSYGITIYFLKMPLREYYFSASIFLMVLSYLYMLKDCNEKCNVQVLKWLVIMLLSFFLVQTCTISGKSLIRSKETQLKISKISNFFSKESHADNLKVYYKFHEITGDYKSSVMKLLIMTKIKSDFTMYSSTGCYVWHESSDDGRYKCQKSNFDLSSNYDVIISEKELDSNYSGYIEYESLEETIYGKFLNVPVKIFEIGK